MTLREYLPYPISECLRPANIPYVSSSNSATFNDLPVLVGEICPSQCSIMPLLTA